MCINNEQNISQLEISFAKMHPKNTTMEHTPSGNNSSNNNNTHKEYGKENSTTTICTQCKKVLLPFTKGSAGISSRNSNNDSDGNDLAKYFEKLQISQSTPHLSHGLCRSCFNNINSDLLVSEFNDINNNNNEINTERRKTILSKSLSSPQLTRHLPTRPKRVLIVDDNSLQRQIHKRMVEHAGYECDVALNGAQALELVQKHSYSYILMDLIMGPMDGWTTSKKIRSLLLQTLGFSSSIPKIIAVTGLNVDEKLTKQCTDAGMDDVMHKPISTEMLHKALHRHSPVKVDR